MVNLATLQNILFTIEKRLREVFSLKQSQTFDFTGRVMDCQTYYRTKIASWLVKIFGIGFKRSHYQHIVLNTDNLISSHSIFVRRSAIQSVHH